MPVEMLRVGQANGAGDEKALFLKVWSGEVIAQFLRANVAMPRTMVRTIQSGKSAQFPVTGKMGAFYHQVGQNLLESANKPKSGERIITIDDMLVSPLFIPKIEEAMAHFDYRSIYSTEAGNALATALDRNVLATGILASRAAGVHSEAPNGRQVVSANALTNGNDLATAIFDAGVILDENDCAEEGRAAFIRPAQYALIVRGSDKAIDSDFAAGNGSYAEGKVYKVNGIELVKTNNLPRTNVTGTFGAKYDVNATATAGLVLHPGAVGTVQLLSLATDMEYKPEYVATFVNSMLAVGHGILRPESAVEIRTAAL